MSDDDREYYDEQDAQAAYDRFRDSLREGAFRYFDVVEFEGIIDNLMDEGDYENAHVAIEHAMTIHPSALPVRIRYAQYLINKGKTKDALEELAFLEKVDSENPDIFLMQGTSHLLEGSREKAESSFRKAVAFAGEEVADILYHIGTSWISVGNLEMAILYFERSFRVDPENEMVLNDLGYFYDQLGYPEKSIRFYNLYLDLDPFNPAVWFNLGIAYNRTSRFEKALEAYEYCLALNESFYHAIFNKANSLANLERYREAIAAYRDYLKSDPENDDAWCYMGECYLNQGRYKMAGRYYQKALSINAVNDIALFSLGIVRWVEKNFRKACGLSVRPSPWKRKCPITGLPTPGCWVTPA